MIDTSSPESRPLFMWNICASYVWVRFYGGWDSGMLLLDLTRFILTVLFSGFALGFCLFVVVFQDCITTIPIVTLHYTLSMSLAHLSASAGQPCTYILHTYHMFSFNSRRGAFELFCLGSYGLEERRPRVGWTSACTGPI